MVDLLDAVTRAMTLRATGSPTTPNSGGVFGALAAYIASQRAEQQSQPQDDIYDQTFPGARRTRKPLYNAEGTPRREVTLDRQMLLGSMGEEQNPAMLLGM